MRILHALSQTELTGSEVYAWELVQRQVSEGHQVFSVSDRFHLDFSGSRIELPLSTASFFQRASNILKLRRLLKLHSIEVIHSHSRGACRHLYWARWGLGIPLVTTIHGRQHFSWSKRLFDIFGDFVFAVSETIRDQLTQNFGRTKPTELLRNPVLFPTAVRSWSQRSVDVLVVGRASGPKGDRLVHLLKTSGMTWTQNKGWRVRAILWGSSAELRQSLQSLTGVEVLSGSTKIAEEYRAAKVVIGAGRVPVEAMAEGCQVVGLGEAGYFGALTAESLAWGLRGNFGDQWVPPTAKQEELNAVIEEALKLSPPESLRQSLRKEYDPELVHRRILEVYRGLRISHRMGWLPILMYHKVTDQPVESKHRIFVTRQTLENHLSFLKKKGFHFLCFQELSDYWFERKSLKTLPRRSVLLTFDDGYRNNAVIAGPLLKKYGARATIFLLADHSVVANDWDIAQGEPREDLLTLQEKKNLDPQVFEVGSHGLRHERLPPKSSEEILSELQLSKKILEHDLGRKINVFAAAFGDIDPRLPDLVREAGYDFAVNTDRGPVAWSLSPRSLFRVSIFPEDNAWSLRKKTSPWYRWYYFKKRGH